VLALLKLLQSLVRTLHSEGTPAQIAAGVTLGAALGLTPLFNLHNLAVVAALALLNVSFAAGLLGMALCAPLGFVLDPLFDHIGLTLLSGTHFLTPLWEALDDAPLLAYTNFNNSVVLGAFVFWLVTTPVVYFTSHWAVLRYRASIGERVKRSRVYRAVRASRAYNVYDWFRD
jgi:uncharacterized protein (TIGR03546 family)